MRARLVEMVPHSAGEQEFSLTEADSASKGDARGLDMGQGTRHKGFPCHDRNFDTFTLVHKML